MKSEYFTKLVFNFPNSQGKIKSSKNVDLSIFYLKNRIKKVSIDFGEVESFVK